AIHYLVAHTLLDVTTLVVAPLVGVVALAIVDVRLAVLSIVPLALGVFWYVRAMRGSGAKFAEYATQQQAISAAVVDFVAGLPTAKLAGAAGGIRTRYAAAVNGFHDFFRAWSRSTAAVTTASWLVVAPGLTAGVFALIGGAGVLAGWMSPTALVAGVLLGPAVSAPVAVGGPRLQAIRTGLSALGSISDMLDEPPLRWADEDPPPRGAPAALDGVTVRFGDRTALDDVSFTLPQRGMVALVGASGGGKSTVAALLARFLDPDAGRVSLDGVTLDRLRESDLYERVAFVFQDTAQRVTTVRDALSGGRAVPGEELVAAAQAAAVHETILALPDGYDTVLGDDTELSSGQRQRIALARALVRDADLLVLDETLSALDATTRSAVLDTLRSQARDRAVLLIAHQLHLVAGVPRILVLDGGRLVGDGSHDDLLDGCPAYRALWNARESASRGDRR
ncbi:ABC transporter ATP-binding protein, partial [Microbacterium sp.]|uniref:ABC transporter ATP-binding protein n=1 Tax=Microbacterium sp. TaxID=51671 RepID=UPI003A84BD5B